MNRRSSGILLHPTSLANSYPIGDLGPAAFAFADFLFESGQRWWQMLPIGPAGKENSPYDSRSAFAGNPLLLSPDRLAQQGLLDREELDLPTSAGEGKVDYSAAARWKLPWLRKAFERFGKTGSAGKRSDFDAFARGESFWLQDFSLFSAVQETEGTSDWTRWNHELGTHRADAASRLRREVVRKILERTIGGHCVETRCAQARRLT